MNLAAVETAPEPRRRGFLVVAVTLIPVLVAAPFGVLPLLGLIARADIDGLSEQATQALPSFGPAAVPELLAVIRQSTPDDQAPGSSVVLLLLSEHCGSKAAWRDALLRQLEAERVPGATAATVLIAAGSFGYHSTRPERIRIARAVLRSRRTVADGRRARTLILTLFADDVPPELAPVRERGPRGFRTIDNALISAPETAGALAVGLSRGLGKPLHLSDQALRRVEPQLPMKTFKTERVTTSAALAAVQGHFSVAAGTFRDSAGQLVSAVRSTDQSGLGVVILNHGDHFKLVTLDEALALLEAWLDDLSAGLRRRD